MLITQNANYNRPSAAASSSGMSYSERTKANRLKGAIYAGVGALDLYAAGAMTVAPDASVFKSMGPWVCGALAVGHAVFAGIRYAGPWESGYDGPSPTFRAGGTARLSALGHAVTALGFAGLAFGAGIYALPVVALGEITGVVGEWMNQQTK